MVKAMPCGKGMAYAKNILIFRIPENHISNRQFNIQGVDMKRVYFYCIMLYAGASMLLAGCAKPYDIIISGGTVIDGTGSGRFSANIGIKDGGINKIGDID